MQIRPALTAAQEAGLAGLAKFRPPGPGVSALPRRVFDWFFEIQKARRRNGFFLAGASEKRYEPPMNKFYNVKLRQQRVGGKVYWGFKGNNTALDWDKAVELIAGEGVHQVEYVSKSDALPIKKYTRITAAEMLKLWKAVASFKQKQEI